MPFIQQSQLAGLIIQGAQGQQGSVGAQGAIGAQGVQGAVGAQGVQGTIGAQGVQGTIGAQGAVGAQGVQGATGSQGVQGVIGAQGVVGAQGVQGTIGAQGAQGAIGAQGLAGAQGVQGSTGPQASPNSYTRTSFTANNSQTTFSAQYIAGYIQVYVNGILLNDADYTATSGSTVVLNTGRAAGDIVETVAFNTSVVIPGGYSANTILFGNTAGFLTGTANLTFDGTNVGIGTASPGYRLHIVGSGTSATARLESTSNTNSQLSFVNTSTSGVGFVVGLNGDSSGNGILYHQDAKDIQIYTSATERMRIDSSGNVGIGTSSPADALNIGTGKKFRATHSANVYQQIFSSSSGNFLNAYGDNFELNADSGAIYLTVTAAQPMVFQTTNTERMRISAAGLVGIGTTSPDAQLDVTRSGNGQIAVLQTSASRGFSFDSQSDTALQIASIQASTNMDLWANTLSFSAGATERMRITSAGQVGIGTSSPDTTTLLTVAGAVTITGANSGHGASRLKLGQDTSAISQIRFYGADASTAGILQFTGSSSDGIVGGERMRIDSSGNVGIGTTSPDIFSNGFERNLGIRIIGDGTTSSINVSGGAASRIQFGVGTTRYGLVYQDASNFMQLGTTTALPISFVTNSTERLRIPADAGGITFPATQVASSNANTLDDYEEGTFTPTAVSQTGSITAYTSEGIYVKVGKLVFIQGNVTTTTAGTAGGVMTLGGFPFSFNGIAGNPGNIAFYGRESQMTGTNFGGYTNGSTGATLATPNNGAMPWGNGYVYPFAITGTTI